MASSGPFGEPSGRLLELFAKTVIPQPYQVTSTIVIQPPSKKGWERLGELQNQRMVGNFFLAEALNRTGENAPSDSDLAQLTQVINDADDAYNRLFFGDQYDNVMAFFADEPPQRWQAFCEDIKASFMPSAPSAGNCPHCGLILDEEQAGKDSAPST